VSPNFVKRDPVAHEYQAAGARIAYVEWGAPADPVILLIHATGFHARCWDEVVRALPPGYRVIAVDTRGHGRSQKTGPITSWADPARDLAELIEHLGLTDAIGAGHSMGGHCLVQIAATHPRAFKRLVLIDPVIMAPELYRGPSMWPPGTEHPVARRRNTWASWDEMFDAFKDRNPYSLWRPQVLEDYCRYGLMPAPGGGFELACPPAIEASVYMASLGTDIYDAVRAIEVPVTILRAKERPPGPRERMDFSDSPTWPQLAAQFKHGRDVYLPHLTHFIPMQEPELAARYIAQEMPA
jgi:pimeloyl-ACP methyl ester carboxylesterase